MLKFNYQPKNKLEKFGEKVYSALVENFSQTFFVGGMVRDALLKRNILDIDITTSALPNQVVNVLKNRGINFNDAYKNLGSVVAMEGDLEANITTLRKDLESKSRYPKVMFVYNAKTDSLRRDFTINALYLKGKDGQILDYHKGLTDLKNKKVKFIGKPELRIKQDPLRVVRALRFALDLNFKIEPKSLKAIKKYFTEIEKLSKNKLNKEIAKSKNHLVLQKVINNPKILDKYFK